MIDLSDREEVLFLCIWNDGETVEIHTQETLWESYKETNLFDGEKNWLCNGVRYCTTSLIEKLSHQHNQNFNETFTNDNMTIQRIK